MPIDDVTDLRVFVQVARSKSLTAAGRALGMTKNGVSRRVQRLEERLGVRLLDRGSRTTALTEEGASFLEPAVRVLSAVDDATESVAARRGTVAGELRVSVPSQLAEAVMQSLPKFLAGHPAASVSVRVSDRPGHVVTEGLDVAVMAGPVPDTSLAVRRLGEVVAVLAASPAYLDRAGRPASPRDLLNHDCLLYGEDRAESAWRLVDEAAREIVVPVRGRLRSSSSAALRDALRAGLGVGLATPADLTGSPVLERVLPRYRFAPFAVSALFDGAKRGSARVRAVLALLDEAVRRVAWRPLMDDVTWTDRRRTQRSRRPPGT